MEDLTPLTAATNALVLTEASIIIPALAAKCADTVAHGKEHEPGPSFLLLRNSYFAAECNLTREQNKKITFEGGVLGPAQDSFAPHSIVVESIHY